MICKLQIEAIIPTLDTLTVLPYSAIPIDTSHCNTGECTMTASISPGFRKLKLGWRTQCIHSHSNIHIHTYTHTGTHTHAHTWHKHACTDNILHTLVILVSLLSFSTMHQWLLHSSAPPVSTTPTSSIPTSTPSGMCNHSGTSLLWTAKNRSEASLLYTLGPQKLS